MCCLRCIFFFKQKTAYWMRISDWSSDVCSSDLIRASIQRVSRATRHERLGQGQLGLYGVDAHHGSCCASRACPAHEIAIQWRPKKPTRPRATAQRDRRLVSGCRSSAGNDWACASRNSGRSEEHTSELQSLMRISYAVFCLKTKNTHNNRKQQAESLR